MKKRMISILICFMLALSASAALSGCNTEREETGNTGNAKDIKWLDFEQWAPDFQLCRISSTFGRVSLNTDLQFVKTGTRSARIDPTLGGWMYFPSLSDNEEFMFDYSDFTYVNYVKIEMHNPQNENKSVGIGFVGTEVGVSINRFGEKNFTLKPGWNTLYLYPDEFLTWMFNFDIENIAGIYFSFERSATNSITESTPHYFIDSVHIVKKDTPAVKDYTEEEAALRLSQMGIKENEIYDFETDVFRAFFTSNLYNVDIVNAADSGLKAPSGDRVLKLEVASSGRGWVSAMVIAPTPIRRVTAALTEEQLKTAYFCFDQYNAASYVENNVVVFNQFQSTNNASLREWSTYSIKLADIVAKNSDEWLQSPGQIEIHHWDNGNELKTFYFDNFRIEIR